MDLLFNTYYSRLVVWADTFLKDIQLAEGVVQEFFIALWEKRKQKELTAPFLTSFLYVSVRNRCLNYLSIIKQELPEEELEGDIPDTSQEEMIERSERDARLWKVIDELPLERRKIFLMCKRDGMRYQEIAAELHISIKTVENQMGKALKTLREMAYRIYLFFFG